MDLWCLAASSSGNASWERSRTASWPSGERDDDAGPAADGCLLSQALEVRSDLADLTHRHPDLAARFIRLRDQLDNDLRHGSDDDDPDRLGHERRLLASQLGAVQEQIRTQDGFASFGLPPSEDELLRPAGQGPVVVFNVSSYRSDALLVTAGKITSLALPDLRQDAAYDQVRSTGPWPSPPLASLSPSGPQPSCS